MLDIRQIRENPQEIEAKLRRKEPNCSLAHIVELDERLRNIKNRVENLKSARNQISKRIGEMKRNGEDAGPLLEEAAAFASEVHALDAEQSKLQEEFDREMALLPNIPMDDIPVSQDVADNKILKEKGKRPTFDFDPKNHLELNERLHLFDFVRSAQTTGSGWPAYRGVGAELEWALINYMIQTHVQRGFTLWMPPLLVKEDALFGAGQLPKFQDQFFRLDDKDYPFCLIPTAEVVLNALHSGEIFEADRLPLLYAAYTPCFRREAGAAGEKERGLIRLHQFNKVEMFAFCRPDESMEVFDQLVCSAEAILEALGLHYRLALLATGDMSFAAVRTIDAEVWLPGQNRYYEVSSISNCAAFQSRRSKVRYRSEAGGKPELVHTLNGSGLATSRLMVALLENNQQEDGSVVVPEVLRPYLGGRERLQPVE